MRLKRLFSVTLSLLLLSALVLGGACAKPATPTFQVADITAARAFQLIVENEGNRGFVVFDVRTPAEYSEGHIAGAVNLDVSSSGFRTEIGKETRAKSYLIYCRTGNRSRQAIEIMRELRFESVYHLANGILEWAGLGLPTVK